jgi:protoporphyrinogen/coproporphyrinogen III oxidase
MRIAVVGGGLAGLSVAWRLRERHDVVVYENAGYVGGNVRSQRFGRYVFDLGPNAFTSNATPLEQLVDEVGLRERTVPAQAAAKRYVYWNGRLHQVPLNPPQALSTQLISPMGKLSALRDLFVRSNVTQTIPNESVDAFFTRHFGEEVAQRIVATALLGITGGDSKRTSVAAIFPRLVQLEREHGSILRASAKAVRTPGTSTSFPNGMGELTQALAAGLGSSLRAMASGEAGAVAAIAREGSGWRLRTSDGNQERFDAAILATPAYAAADLLAPVDRELAELLRGIEYAPMRVAGVAFRKADVTAPIDGFGFLAARNSGVRILGALYTSSLFPQQAPQDVVYLRVFLGGAFDPQAAACDDDATRGIVRADLRRVLGIDGPVQQWNEVVWPRAIPQYALDHTERLSAIDARTQAMPNLWLTGNAYRGVGITDVVRDAFALAERLSGSSS